MSDRVKAAQAQALIVGPGQLHQVPTLVRQLREEGQSRTVGLIVAIIQHVTLTPLILTAELYEDGKLTVQRKQTTLPTDIGAQVAFALPAVIGKAQAHDEHAAAANATASGSPT